MSSGNPPLVLLHPWLMAGNAWREVVPLVSGAHEVFTPTALGHRGGPPAGDCPVRIWDVIDAAERYLDEQGLQKPHLAGNSMGGFIALELARRGRAATVCAFSPAGFWATRDALRKPAVRKARRLATMGHLIGPALPWVAKPAFIRRLSFRVLNAARYGDRFPVDRTVEVMGDVVACTATDIFSTDEEQIAPLDPLPCPITVAWAEKDTMIPLRPYGELAHHRVPRATFTVLPDVGHVPMVDDPELVARTILMTTRVGMRQP